MCAVQVNSYSDPFDHAVRYGIASTDAVVLLDTDGIPKWANAAAYALHGVTSLGELGILPDEYIQRLHALCPSSFGADPDSLGFKTSRLTQTQPQNMRTDCYVSTAVLRKGEQVVGHAITVTVHRAPAPGAEAAHLPPGSTEPATALLQCLEPIIVDLKGASAEPHPAATLAHSMAEHGSTMSGQLCNMVPAPIFVLDAERRVVAASDVLLDLLGYASPDFLGHHIVEFLAGSSIRFFKDVFWPGLSDCGLAEDRACELLTSKGGTLRARLAGCPVLDGHMVRCVTCVVEDLSEHDFSEAKFAGLFALSPVAMLVRKLEDGRILHTNPALLSLTGHAPDTLNGHTMDEVAVFESSAMRHRFERELRMGRPLRGTVLRLKAADGALLDVQATATAVQVSSQSCALVILQDAASGRFDEQQMFRAIEAVMSDTSWFSRSVVEKLASVRVPGTLRMKAGELDDLTKREREVLAMISHGWGDAEIASRLSLTRSTVRNHVAALYSKIDVHSRSSAIIWARERALNVIHPAAELRQMPPCRGVLAHPRAERVRTTP